MAPWNILSWSGVPGCQMIAQSPVPKIVESSQTNDGNRLSDLQKALLRSIGPNCTVTGLDVSALDVQNSDFPGVTAFLVDLVSNRKFLSPLLAAKLLATISTTS